MLGLASVPTHPPSHPPHAALRTGRLTHTEATSTGLSTFRPPDGLQPVVGTGQRFQGRRNVKSRFVEGVCDNAASTGTRDSLGDAGVVHPPPSRGVSSTVAGTWPEVDPGD